MQCLNFIVNDSHLLIGTSRSQGTSFDWHDDTHTPSLVNQQIGIITKTRVNRQFPLQSI